MAEHVPSDRSVANCVGPYDAGRRRSEGICFTRNLPGKVESVTDPEDNTTQFAYDRLDRLASETNQLQDTRAFDYDAAGNLIRQTDRNGRVTEYVYDPVGQQTHEKWLRSGSEVLRTIHRVYDPASSLPTSSRPTRRIG